MSKKKKKKKKKKKIVANPLNIPRPERVLRKHPENDACQRAAQGGGKLRGRETIPKEPSPTKTFLEHSPPHIHDTFPALPFGDSLLFSLEEMGNDETNTTFWGLQKWFRRVRSIVCLSPKHRTIRIGSKHPFLFKQGSEPSPLLCSPPACPSPAGIVRQHVPDVLSWRGEGWELLDGNQPLRQLQRGGLEII